MIKPSPKLWKKLTDKEKTMWKLLYKEFTDDLNYCNKSKTFEPTKREFEIIAHNLAFNAIWIFKQWEK